MDILEPLLSVKDLMEKDLLDFIFHLFRAHYKNYNHSKDWPWLNGYMAPSLVNLQKDIQVRWEMVDL